MILISITHNLLASWKVLSFLSILTLIGFYLSYRVTLKRCKHDYSAPILFQLIGPILLLPLAFISRQPLPFVNGHRLDWTPLLLFLTAGVFYAIHDRLQGTVRKNVDVSVSGVIDLTVHVFLIISATMLFREQIALQQLLGILLVFIANFNIIYDYKTHKLNKYWGLGIIANVAYAIGILVDVDLSNGHNLPFYIVFSYLWVATVIIVVTTILNRWPLRQTLKRIFSDLNKRTFIPHLLTAFFSIYYTFALLSTYRHGNIALATTIISSTVIYNTILSAIFLKERKDLATKIMSAVLGVIGIILIIIDV